MGTNKPKFPAGFYARRWKRLGQLICQKEMSSNSDNLMGHSAVDTCIKMRSMPYYGGSAMCTSCFLFKPVCHVQPLNELRGNCHWILCSSFCYWIWGLGYNLCSSLVQPSIFNKTTKRAKLRVKCGKGVFNVDLSRGRMKRSRESQSPSSGFWSETSA